MGAGVRAPAARAGLRTIFRAAVAVGVATTLVRLLGLVKNQAIAAAFGVGLDVECFLFASILPTFAFGVLANFLPSALLPTLAALRAEEGEGAGRRLIAELVGWSLLVWVGVGLLGLALWPGFLALAGADFAPEKARLCTRLFHVMLPALVLHGVASLYGAILNADKRFLGPVLALGAIPLGVSVAALGFADRGAGALAVGYVAGVAVELALVLALGAHAGIPLAPRAPTLGPAIRRVLAQYLPVLGGGLLMRSTTLVDQAMAAALPAGNLAALGYADAAVSAILAIGASALGTAILPYLSDMAAARDVAGIRRSLRAYGGLVLAVSVPVAVLTCALARPAVALLFERGAFRPEDTRSVGWILALYALQIPFFTVGILCARVLSALAMNRRLFWIAGLNLVLDVGLNLAFIPWLGAGGIALSTALVYLVSMGVLWRAAQGALRDLGSGTPAPSAG